MAKNRKNFTDSRAFALLMCIVLLAYLMWAIPTCIRGPVDYSSESIHKYHEELEALRDELEPMNTPGMVGYGYTQIDPNRVQKSYGIGLSVSTGYMQHSDNTENVDR